MDWRYVRPRRTGAERRAQRARAEGRVAQHLLRSFAALDARKGSAATRLGRALAEALRACGPARDLHESRAPEASALAVRAADVPAAQPPGEAAAQDVGNDRRAPPRPSRLEISLWSSSPPLFDWADVEGYDDPASAEQVADLERQLADKDSEITALLRKLQGAEKLSKEADAKNDALSQEREGLSAQLEGARREIEGMKGEEAAAKKAAADASARKAAEEKAAREEADRWINLARKGGGEIEGVKYTPNGCCLKAVGIFPGHARAWNSLGADGGGGQVNGVAYTKKDCYLKALDIDPNFAKGWSSLGTVGGGEVGGSTYTERECYIRALEIDPNVPVRWKNLGKEGGGTVQGAQYTAEECYIKALEIDPNDDELWVNLGNQGGGTVQGVQYTAEDCARRAKELEPDFQSHSE